MDAGVARGPGGGFPTALASAAPESGMWEIMVSPSMNSNLFLLLFVSYEVCVSSLSGYLTEREECLLLRGAPRLDIFANVPIRLLISTSWYARRRYGENMLNFLVCGQCG